MLERSCGTVLFQIKDNTVFYVLVQSTGKKLCGFPKGHVEQGETEEQTACRETWEETSITPKLITDFRKEIEYPLKNGNTKRVVLFLADCTGETPKHNQGFEDMDYHILPLDQALEALTFEQLKNILRSADEYIKRNNLA